MVMPFRILIVVIQVVTEEAGVWCQIKFNSILRAFALSIYIHIHIYTHIPKYVYICKIFDLSL